MGYTPLSNWKYDNIEVDKKVNLHRIQSGPARPGYFLVDRPNGGYGLNDLGPNMALPYLDAPPVVYGGGEYDDAWRQVPLAVEDYYNGYQGDTGQSNFYLNANHARVPLGSGVAYNDTFVQGYETVAGVQKIANAYVPIKLGSEYNNESGVKRSRFATKYTYFDGISPAITQYYTPYDVPRSVTVIPAQTGFTAWARQATSILTHRVGSSLSIAPEGETLEQRAARFSIGVDRSNWIYNPPVYCQVRTEWRQMGNNIKPGNQPNVIKYTYRDKATSYGLNYGAAYYLSGDSGIRGVYRGFSPSVGPSNVSVNVTRR